MCTCSVAQWATSKNVNFVQRKCNEISQLMLYSSNGIHRFNFAITSMFCLYTQHCEYSDVCRLIFLIDFGFVYILERISNRNEKSIRQKKSDAVENHFLKPE